MIFFSVILLFNLENQTTLEFLHLSISLFSQRNLNKEFPSFNLSSREKFLLPRGRTRTRTKKITSSNVSKYSDSNDLGLKNKKNKNTKLKRGNEREKYEVKIWRKNNTKWKYEWTKILKINTKLKYDVKIWKKN